jgi:hypothetical protein
MAVILPGVALVTGVRLPRPEGAPDGGCRGQREDEALTS